MLRQLSCARQFNSTRAGIQQSLLTPVSALCSAALWQAIVDETLQKTVYWGLCRLWLFPCRPLIISVLCSPVLFVQGHQDVLSWAVQFVELSSIHREQCGTLANETSLSDGSSANCTSTHTDYWEPTISYLKSLGWSKMLLLNCQVKSWRRIMVWQGNFTAELRSGLKRTLPMMKLVCPQKLLLSAPLCLCIYRYVWARRPMFLFFPSFNFPLWGYVSLPDRT